LQTEPWVSFVRENTPTTAISVPLFVSQGTADLTVPPETTKSYVQSLCAAGAQVDFQTLNGYTHMGSVWPSTPLAIAWIANRFAGVTPPSNCSSLR
jgi:acetyl esterase/lipase